MESRPIAPAGTTPWVEIFELRLSARTTQRSEPHAPGTREILVVLSGSLRIDINGTVYDLEAGDSVAFRADQAGLQIFGCVLGNDASLVNDQDAIAELLMSGRRLRGARRKRVRAAIGHAA